MKRSNNITWWDFRVPRLENWLRSDKSSMSDPDQLFLDSYVQSNDFAKDLAPVLTQENVNVANVIAAENLGIINKRLGNTGYGRLNWILYLGITAALITSAWLLWPETKVSRDYSPRTIHVYSTTPTPSTEPQNIVALNEPETTPDQKKSIERTLQNESITETGSDVNANNTIVLDSIETIINEQSESTNKQHKRQSKPVSGHKLTTGTEERANKRDPSVPIQLDKVFVARKDNYWLFVNGSDRSNEISFSPSEMPSYRGGDERLTEDLAYFIRKQVLKESYTEPVSVLVSFVIDPKGRMEKIDIRYANTEEIKTGIIAALNDLDIWQRGSKSGKRGSMYYEIAISFN